MRVEIHRWRMAGSPHDDGLVAVAYNVLVPLEDCVPNNSSKIQVLLDRSVYKDYAYATWPTDLPPGWERYEAWLAHERAAKRRMLEFLHSKHCPETRALDEWPTLWASIPPELAEDLHTIHFTIPPPGDPNHDHQQHAAPTHTNAAARPRIPTAGESTMSDTQPTTPEHQTEWPVIHAYTRAEALADGVLVDVTSAAREAGFKVPTAVTAAVFDECIEWTESDAEQSRTHQDQKGRLWDVVYLAAFKARTLVKRGVRQNQLIFLLRSCRGRGAPIPAAGPSSSSSAPATTTSPSPPSCFPTKTEPRRQPHHRLPASAQERQG